MDSPPIAYIHSDRCSSEFDPAKDAANQKKHGVSLARAADFDLRGVLTYPARSAQGEARTQVLGNIGGTVYSAIVTERVGRSG